LKEIEGKEQYRVEASNMFAGLEILEAEIDINSLAKESIDYNKLKKHKS
jgi:hypothetical protein